MQYFMLCQVFGAGEAPPKHQSLAVISKPMTEGWHLNEMATRIVISTTAVTTHIDGHAAEVRLTGKVGNLIAEESSRPGWEFMPE